MNGQQVTFERYVPYSDSQTVTLSAGQLTAYTAYYTQQAHYRAITDVSGGALSFGSDHGFTTGQAVVYEADGAEIDITGGGSLVNGQTYYVIATTNPTQLELASDRGERNCRRRDQPEGCVYPFRHAGSGARQ